MKIYILSPIRLTLSILILISFSSLTGCNDNLDDETAAIEGKWDRGDIVIEISGSEGLFHDVKSGNWLSALNNYIEIGDPKFRNIERISDNEWTLDELWFTTIDDSVTGVEWGTLGSKIKLSDNSNSITVFSVSSITGRQVSTSYTRLNE